MSRRSEPDLFAQAEKGHLEGAQPLAARMRPKSLSEFVGQTHFLGEGKLLRRLIDSKRIGSLLLYGPPGTGKTTLAQLLAAEIGSQFRQLSAVLSGLKELREVLEWARDEVASGARKPLLFIDEIHRFNRSQQDALLPDVEEGIIDFVGATTSNPFFAVNSALLSRSQIFQFQPISEEELVGLMQRAISDRARGFGNTEIRIHEGALELLARIAEGDARRVLGALEVAILSSHRRPIELTRELAQESVQKKSLVFDPSGDEHYDLASALIKSIRGSDVDASLYWIARGLESGEDLRFLCRRLIILASEDIGNADPQALSMAIATMQTCEFVGLPECQWSLSQLVIYLALAPKSNAATLAISAARKDVLEGSLVPVPVHLRDKHYDGAAKLGHGEGYLYAHDSSDGIAEQDYLGVDRRYYFPTERGFEKELADRNEKIKTKLRGGDA